MDSKLTHKYELSDDSWYTQAGDVENRIFTKVIFTNDDVFHSLWKVVDQQFKLQYESERILNTLDENSL